MYTTTTRLYARGGGGGGRCIFSVYLGMECHRAVGLFLPGMKKIKKNKNKIVKDRKRTNEDVSLATGNFLLEPEWRTGVWLPNKSVAREKIPTDVPKKYQDRFVLRFVKSSTGRLGFSIFVSPPPRFFIYRWFLNWIEKPCDNKFPSSSLPTRETLP